MRATLEHVKTCAKCGESRPNEDFARNKRAADGLQSRCRVCNNAWAKAHYDAFSQEKREHYTDRVSRRNKEVRAWINSFKDQPCMDCGGTFPAVAMDFDHRPGEVKVKEVNKMYKNSKAAILAEIAKCDVVCANCHRIRTQQRLLVGVE